MVLAVWTPSAPTFTNIKKTSQHRALTNVFRIAPDDVIIFGGQDYKGNDFDTIIVDRLKGEPFTDPFFETWKPTHLHISIHNDDSFIGDEAKGFYSYLFPVKNKEGQLAIAKADGTDSCGSKGSERIHHGQRFHSSDQQPYIHPVHRL